MARNHTPLQKVKEAKQIALDHNMFIAECRSRGGAVDYVVYRKLPDGRNTRLGKRSSPDGLRQFVARCAQFR